MERYLVIGGGPISPEQLELGQQVWLDTIREFPDIKTLVEVGNFSSGRLVLIFETPSLDRLNDLFQRFQTKWLESGIPMEEKEGEPKLEILPVDYHYEMEQVVYRPGVATAGGVVI